MTRLEGPSGTRFIPRGLSRAPRKSYGTLALFCGYERTAARQVSSGGRPRGRQPKAQGMATEWKLESTKGILLFGRNAS
eukprot:7188410-Prymnesium_polylepis.1